MKEISRDDYDFLSKEQLLGAAVVITRPGRQKNLATPLVPCCLVEVYQCCTGVCCLHHQGDKRPDGGSSKQVMTLMM
jgi:hypothetical protein